MNCKLYIRDYVFDTIPENNYIDVMDGTADSMSFSFPYSENIAEIINLKEKVEVQIYDGDYPEVGTYNDTYVTINNIRYEINGYNILLNNEILGIIDTNSKTLKIKNKNYFYIDNIIYYDNRFHYYMCISQISSEKLSTDSDNGYMITVLLKEQTVLLKDCVRTDIAITPSLYPQDLINDKGELYQVFDTLYDAVLKIVDCHNMCTLNDTILDIDSSLIDALKKVACPNLTYRDLSTYSQLYDVFMRVGRIPYYENGILYGLSLQGEYQDEVINLDNYSNLSYIKEEGTNDNIYSSKVYNTIYDNESAVVPQIFCDIVNDIEKPRGTINLDNNSIKIGSRDIYIINDELWSQIVGEEGLTNVLIGKIYKSNMRFEITYNIYEKGQYRYKDGEIYYINSDNLGYDFSSSSITKIEDATLEKINNWINDEFKKWTMLTSQSDTDISKTLLFVSGFNTASAGIDDARNYFIELPYNIQDIEAIYTCSPRIIIDRGLENSVNVYFTWRLNRLDDNRIIENSSYEMLSSLQKRTMSYYVRGSKKIQNILASLVSVDLSDTEGQWNQLIINPSEEDLYGSFAWSNSKLYALLRQKFFVVRFKPMLDSIYTNYDYYKNEPNKSKAVKNFNLPYSQTTDRQIYPILEYNLEKGLDTSFDVKIITNDVNILNAKAGTIVKYENKEYIVNKVVSYINNKSIESLFYLTDNIVQNSIISSYSDNVRISSIMSAETTVDRYVHLFSENVITLSDYNEPNSTIRKSNFDFVTEEIGDCLSRHGLFNLGLCSLPNDSLNVYKYTSKYPFKFNNIVQNVQDTSNQEIEFYIKMTTGTSLDSLNRITLKMSDFPVTLYQRVLYLEGGSHRPSMDQADTKYQITVNNPSELSRALYSFGYCIGQENVLGNIIDKQFYFLSISTSNNNLFSIYPGSYDDASKIPYWNYTFRIRFFGDDENPIIGNYRFTEKGKEFSTTLYGTEKLMTTTGLITKIEYSFPNSSYCTAIFESASLSNLTYIPDKPTAIDYNDLSINSATPVYFNRTDTGCVLSGLGNRESEFYSLYSLPHISDKGYTLDLRENPRPYIQYKTIARGSNTIDLKSLSKSVSFMKAQILQPNSTSTINKYYILKCPKFTNIDTFEIPDTYYDFINGGYVASEAIIESRMTENSSAILSLEKPISKSDDYDYILCGLELGLVEEGKISKYINILKFNIKNDYSVNKLCLKSEVFSNN